MSTPAWNQWLKEQTPGTLKIDKQGTRALGYKRFRLANLMAFARRSRCRPSLQPPYVVLTPVPEEGDYDPNTGTDDDDDDANDGWPAHMVNKPKPSVHRKVSKKLQSDIGGDKARHCEHVISFFELPPEKVGVRCVTSLGSKHPVALLFRVTDCEVRYSILKKIDTCQWVKSCYVNMGSDRVTQLKVVVW